MLLVSIDVGILNLGFAAVEISESDSDFKDEAEEVHMLKLALVDLTELDEECDASCTIPHTKHIVDRVQHFVAKYAKWLDAADTILVERQPIQGLTAVEALLVHTYRDKVHLVHPICVHRHFCFGDADYDARKALSTTNARSLLKKWTTSTGRQKNNSNILAYFSACSRKHDMSDALLFIEYYLATVVRAKRKQKRKPLQPVHSLWAFAYKAHSTT